MIIYDIEDGHDLGAAVSFIEALRRYIADSRDVTITVGNIQFKAYDHDALIQGLIDAVQYFQSELER
jgi:hypothetical protein